MPKGRRETFRIEIFPDAGQKRALQVLESVAADVHKAVEIELAREYNLIRLFKSGREVLEMVEREVASPPLTEFSLKAAVASAHAAFLVRVEAAAGADVELRRGRRIQPEVDVPKNEVIFSATAQLVRVPYIGLVRHAANMFITADPLARETPTENKADVNRRVRRAALGRQAGTYYLLLDCTDEAVPRRVAAARRRKRRRLPKLLE